MEEFIMNKNTDNFNEQPVVSKGKRAFQIIMLVLSAICAVASLYFSITSITITIAFFTEHALNILVFIVLSPYWLIGLIANIVILIITAKNAKDPVIKWAYYISLASLILFVVCLILFFVCIISAN